MWRYVPVCYWYTCRYVPVCYREAAPEQLEAYLEEVTQEGRMEGEMERVLQQVHEARPPPPQATQVTTTLPYTEYTKPL